MRLASTGVLIALLVMGCGDDDSLPRVDGSVRIDGGGSDGGGGDGGGIDGGSRDAGPRPDGSAADAGGTDASASDGGTDGGPVSMPCMAAGACDPFDPSACPDGESCRPSTVGGTSCQPIIATPLGEDEPCSTPQDCAPGMLCLSFPGDAEFTCQPMCAQGSIGACSDGKACFGTIGDPCIQICRPIAPPCDIYAQDCADAADTCTFARHPETDAPYTACRPAGTQGHGDPCGGMDGTCGHSLVCIRTDMITTCRYVCDPSGGSPTCTEPGETCTGLARTWMVGYCE